MPTRRRLPRSALCLEVISNHTFWLRLRRHVRSAHQRAEGRFNVKLTSSLRIGFGGNCGKRARGLARAEIPSRTRQCHNQTENTTDLRHLCPSPPGSTRRSMLSIGARRSADLRSGRYAFTSALVGSSPALTMQQPHRNTTTKTARIEERACAHVSSALGAYSSSILISRGVNPCSREYCAIVSITLRLALTPWWIKAVLASPQSKPAAR